MDGSGVTRGALHGSHWGAFYPLPRDGRVVGVEPFDRDPDPSAILQSIPAALEHRSRVRRPMLRLNFEDAAARGLNTGSIARIFNDRGACLASVVVSPEIRQSIVQISTGAWYDPEAWAESGRPGATHLERHGNPNVLTLDKGTSRLAQGPSAQTALVEIERFEGELPAMEAFEPPV
jgi:Molydopterin dinucleotide binding domain/Molybdopterin oxidoreductase N-terminal domain